MADSNIGRILVVDDDVGLLRLIQKTLEREGFLAAAAKSGEEAMRWLNGNSAELLLLDLKLQDTDGRQFIGRLDSAGLKLPFVVITGQGDERVAVEMMKRGALDYVVKDTNFLEFLPTVVRHALTQVKREKRLAAAEKTVQENEQRFRETLDNMIEGCQTLGFDWRYLYVNEAAACHGRRSITELLGRTMMEVYPGIETTPLFAQLAECMKNRTGCNVENEFHYGKGESAWFQLSIQPVPEGLFILSLDITKRKESEGRRKFQSDSALILAESTSLNEALLRILERICQTFEWTIGEFWMVDPASNLLRLARAWRPSEGESSLWDAFTENQTLELGSGVPGRVWASRTAAYIPKVEEDDNCKQGRLAARLGMRSAFAFPILLRNEVLGVLSFFGTASRQPDEDLLSCFAALGSQLSQFIERKQLERDVLEISHQEQSRLGRDLHDGLGQQLTALELFSVSLAGEIEPKSLNLAKKVRKMGEHLREAIKQTRAMANGLSPVSLNEGGLMTALSKLAEGIRAMAKVDCKFLCPAPVEVEPGPANHLYRIAQETTNNALKHGRARKIRISLTKRDDGLVQLAISDNGRGFSITDAKSDGMGLRAMKYRADLIGADLNVDSEYGKGTCVTCLVRKCK